VNTYCIEAVLRDDFQGRESMERIVESRVTASTELLARRLFLERVWANHLLCSQVLRVRYLRRVK
jgi:hypothetical protein